MATWKPCPFAGPKYDPLSLMCPLMRNWTEPITEKRDKYDYDYGRGVGMRMIEKMNKTGVFYRTGNMKEEEENLYDDINESTNDGAFVHKEFVYQSDKDNYGTPSQGKINKQKDDDEEFFNKVDGKKSSADADTYMALNKDNTHWVTVVMHKQKEEFQVLDSLMGKELDSTTRKLVKDLRREIEADIAEANATGSVQYPDVSTWPIKTYDVPQQKDGNSCGLFVLHCFKNWNGDTWDRSFSQRSIDGSRELMIGQLIFAFKNTFREIKDKVIRIARRKK
ncbi:hypothetical protein D1007_08364 [Hordeum vulgare]|nr:hypothetical protein D1007_08364 [Hordeum vulgare]